MSKIYAFIVVMPLIFIVMIKGIGFYEFDTKQRYIDNLIENISYKVKITGIITSEELYGELLYELQKIADFDQSSIILQKNTYINGTASDMVYYTPGETLNKGDGFLIYVESKELLRLSRIMGLGSDEEMKYRSKSYIRVERYGVE